MVVLVARVVPPMVPAEGLEPPTTGLRTPRLYPLSYAGMFVGRTNEKGSPVEVYHAIRRLREADLRRAKALFSGRIAVV
jgi:hypothetical protein